MPQSTPPSQNRVDALPDVDLEPIDIRLRAFLGSNLTSQPRPTQPRPSKRTLTFDCETLTDMSQRLRFGAFRLDDEIDGAMQLIEEGLFFDEAVLKPAELDLLKDHAHANGMRLFRFEEFTEQILFQQCYDLSGTIVGFNLPFDLSRLALNAVQARATSRSDEKGEKQFYDRRFKSGFAFKMSNDPKQPDLRIKHVDRRRSFIQFHKENWSGYVGYFVDVRTLAAALLTGTSTLGSVAKLLRTKTQKSISDEHGAELSTEYIDYAINDVRCTWECYSALVDRLAKHALADLRPMDVFSEASIGKGYLRAMGIKPWRHTANVFTPELIGIIMSSYFGGRTEVRIRREVREVIYADFLSMYPTVNTLQGLWRFLIAEETMVDESDAATDWARSFLDDVIPEMMLDQNTWPKLTALVQVQPDDDLLPIRAAFGTSKSTNIGLNYLTSKKPLWFTLADCVAAKLLTGKTPRILKAIRFSYGAPQDGLQPKNILGLENADIHPLQDDFFKRLIELRQDVKNERDMARDDQEEYDRLNTDQDTIKIIANSTSYGHLIEMNPDRAEKKKRQKVYGFSGTAQEVNSEIVETPGEYFHPLLATLITGAARLMLALAERKALEEGLIWSFCDTDGLALAKPEDITREDFYARADRVIDWFKALNPYAGQAGKSILQKERENSSRECRRTPKPLYCYAVSAKRYALFNIEDGMVLIRKASAHGLGFWRAPFIADGEAPDTGTPFWQSELWRLICQAALDGRDGDGFSLFEDQRFSKIAAGQSTVSKWEFYNWFDRFNEGRDYRDRVQPFNFLLRFPTKRRSEIDEQEAAFSDWCDLNPGEPSLVAPYDAETNKASKHAFHRDAKSDSNEAELDYSVWLTTFADVLREYDVHAEAKFHGSSPLQSGALKRRRVSVEWVLNVGKESHEWEENEALGLKLEPEVQFGEALPSAEEMQALIKAALDDGVVGSNELCRLAGVSKTSVSAVRNSNMVVNEKSLKKMFLAITTSM